jgi:peptidoglycan hydrolase-like protein with peptidoglycan-binding domain
LVRRRQEEAHLFLTGVYKGVGDGVPRTETRAAPKKPDPVVKEAQEILTARGFNPGAIDGWMGAKTRAAVIAYQKAHPHLVNDGVIGPATIAQLRRDAAAAKDAVTKGSGSVLTAGVTAWAAGLPWAWIVGGVALLAAGYFAWRYRDVIARRWNALRGKVVEV